MSTIDQCCIYLNILEQCEMIRIIDSEKVHENHSSYIVYIIQFLDRQVRRRYSEFESFQLHLSKLHPEILIPPIPNKHTLAQYATKQNRAKDDVMMIEKRKRMLQSFLNRLLSHPFLVKEHLFHRFLDKDSNWNEVVNTPIIPHSNRSSINIQVNGETIENTNNINNTKIASVKSNGESHFSNAENFTLQVQSVLTNQLFKAEKGLNRKLSECSKELSELGALYNGFSLTENEKIGQALEKVGQAVDISYMSMVELFQLMDIKVSEPLEEYIKYSETCHKVLKYRQSKQKELEKLTQILSKKKQLIRQLQDGELESKRLEAALQREIEARDPYSDDDSIYNEDELKNHPNLPIKNRSRSNSYLSNHSLNINNINNNSNNHNINPVIPENSVVDNNTDETNNNSNRNSGIIDENTTKAPSANGGANILNLLSYTFHGLIDVDPEASRRNSISKNKEQILVLEEQINKNTMELAELDNNLQNDLNRFQYQKMVDFHTVMLDLANIHVNWCKDNLDAWQEAHDKAIEIPGNRKVIMYNCIEPKE
ncbi:PX-domain-containing protein [Neoconidiobolus thromboides FSU 785]|nr:PX-domain-containing protein [Neoconidiobolus thromboides FSU 785]